MTHTPAQQHQKNVLLGRYLGLTLSSKGKPKSLKLATSQGEQVIKLPKYVGYALRQEVEPGAWVRVWVQPKGDSLRAILVVPLSPKEIMVPPESPVPASPVGKIQVCKKGSCAKRGSQEVWQTLKTALQQDSCGSEVVLEGTSCLKACKKGPNIRLWPDQVQYNQVQPSQIPAILQQHFSRNGQ